MIQPLIADINNITNDEKEKLWDFVGVYSDEEIVDCSINEGVQHCNDYKLQVKKSYSYYAQQYNDLERKFRKQTVDAFEKLLDKNKHSVKQGTWSNVENHKIYADWLFIKLGYKTMEDWYKININMIHKNRGGGLLPRYYNGSPIKFLKQVYPDIQWLPWKMTSAPNKFWNDMVNQKLFTEWLFNKLGYTSMEDWYEITGNIIIKNDGGGLYDKYNGSCSQLLQGIYPDIAWLPWKFVQTTKRYWNCIENRKLYANWLFNKLGYTSMEDLYNITEEIVNNNYGGGLLGNYYKGSLIHFLRDVYPDIEWLQWKMSRTENNYWDNMENRKLFAKWLFNELGYTSMEDWYNITKKIFNHNHGSMLLGKYYNSSPIQFLRDVYPDIEWLPWKMCRTQKNFWNDMVNQRNFTEWLFNKLGYTSMKDWYKITRYIICKNYGSGLLSLKYNYSSSKMLTTIYPEYNWDISKFKKSYSIGQIEWLNYLCVNTPDIRHMINNDEGEFNIPNSNYKADGYSKINNTIYEYHGDFWHGNPKIYNSDDINPITKTTYKELYNKTIQKQSFCEDNHYKYVSIWESEWLRGKIALIKIQRKYKTSQN